MISFVYFDVGGVVVKDFAAGNGWDLLREDFGIPSSNREKFIQFWWKDQIANCTFRDVQTRVPLLEKEFGIQVPHDFSVLSAFVKHFKKNESLWPVITEVKKHTRIGLLTNMFPGMFEVIQKTNLLPNVTWDAIVDSSIVGYAKPDKKIFEIAQEKINVASKEILFVENSLSHVQAAKDLGWQTFHYDCADYEKSSKEFMKFYKNVL